jgi:hypothetical protein
MKKVLSIALLGTIALWVTARAFAAHSDLGCLNCHAPHHAGDPNDPKAYGVPLWNNANTKDGLPVFTLYSSKSFTKLGVTITQPDGASKLCLGCHDGSYTGVDPKGSKIFLAADLARSHPVSFVYDSALAAKAPNSIRDPSSTSGFGGTITQDLLDSQNKMQCTSCHDIHVGGKTVNHLRWDPGISLGEVKMCNTCHNK